MTSSSTPQTYQTNRKWLTLATLIAIAIIYIIHLLPTTKRTRARMLTSTPPTTNTSSTKDDEEKVIIPSRITRAFPQWSKFRPGTTWCTFPTQSESNGLTGLIYIKTYKAGSSTLAGVTARIARRMSGCNFKWKHAPVYEYRQRDRARSFLFGSLRHPTKRAVSHAFYEFSKKGLNVKDLEDDNVIEELEHWSEPLPLRWSKNNERDDWMDRKWASFMLAWLSDRAAQDLYLPEAPLEERSRYVTEWEQDLVGEVIKNVDLLIVSERMDESLVVLMMLLDLDFGDVLFLKSKVSGEQYAEDMGAQSCTFIQKAELSSGVEEYLQSPEWHERVSGDMMLYTAANRCLDKTITSLGHDTFEKNLKTFQEYLRVAEEECVSEAIFPCDREGVFHPGFKEDCEMGDKGCGMVCLDRLAKRFKTKISEEK